jgi:hypothetical protein
MDYGLQYGAVQYYFGGWRWRWLVYGPSTRAFIAGDRPNCLIHGKSIGTRLDRGTVESFGLMAASAAKRWLAGPWVDLFVFVWRSRVFS